MVHGETHDFTDCRAQRTWYIFLGRRYLSFIGFQRYLTQSASTKGRSHFKVDIKPRLGVLILIYLWFQEGRGGYKIIWNHVGTIEEKAMAPQSSTLAWKIPWMEEPGGLQSMGSLKVGHDWATSLSLFTFMHWRRKWQPTPVFLPGESQGRGSLVGCLLWGRTESNTTEAT